MIQMKHFHTVLFDTYFVKYERVANLAAVPYVGSIVSYPDGQGYYKIDDVIFVDGGEIEISSRERDDNCDELVTYPDRDYEHDKDDMVDLMGWSIAVDRKRRSRNELFS